MKTRHRVAINDNGQIVWVNFRNIGSDSEIFFYDGNEILRLTNNTSLDNAPSLNNRGHAVWQRYVGNNYEIFYYDGTSIVQLSNNQTNDLAPQINNADQVVWQFYDGNDYEIMYYDGVSIRQLTNNSVNDRLPNINDAGLVTWKAGSQAYGYDGAQVVQLTKNTGTVSVGFPQINNKGDIAWTATLTGIVLAERDSDMDGIPDKIDFCPGFDNSQDSDSDGVPDGCDGCVDDIAKTTPGVCGCGIADTDSDDDTYADCIDAFPTDPAASVDTDGDGHPDNWNAGKTATDSTTGLSIDAFSNDPTEWADSDNDGVGDNSDAFPNDPNESVDSDGDGVGDNADICPGFDDSVDSDLDGIPDGCDNCVDISNPQQMDCDVDGIGDACDADYPCMVSGLPQQKILASDGTANDNFGDTVAISGDFAIVGAPNHKNNSTVSGAAYIYRYNGAAWIEQQKFTPVAGNDYDRFGASVAIDGNYAIVGAAGDDATGNDTGAVYIYHFTGTTWVEQQKIKASDSADYDYFGSSVAIYYNCAVVGAPHDSDNGSLSGSAYIYHFNGTTWVEQQKLTASDGTAMGMLALPCQSQGTMSLSVRHRISS